MSRKPIIISVAVLAFLAAAGATAYFETDWFGDRSGSSAGSADNTPSDSAPTPAPVSDGAGSKAPIPVVAVVDRSAIMQYSKAGQDMARQIQAYVNQAKTDMAGPANALRGEGEALKRDVQKMAPDVRQKRIADFEARQAAFQQQLQKKDDAVKQAVAKARASMEQTVGPILKQAAAERGANMVLDKQAVLFATDPKMDLTPEVIQKLDAKLPAIKIDIAATK